MADFALVALDGAYHSSVGALADSYALARDRVANVFAEGSRPMEMQTALRVLSQDGAEVTLSDGMRFGAHAPIDTETPYSFIWLPAFRAGSIAMLRERLARSAPSLAWLRRQIEGGAVVGASGAAVSLLIAAGLTRNMTVPVARALQPVIRTLFPGQRLEERLALVDHGNILIANGLANDLSLIVRVMARTLSPDIARWLTSIMGLSREEEHLVAADPLVARAQLWLERHFTTRVNLVELASSLPTSPATLNRRFHKALQLSPKAYVEQLRLQAAKQMLEKSQHSIDRIAELVGYSDSRLFRAMFRRRTGMTATEWRKIAHEADSSAGQGSPASRAAPVS